MAVWQHGILMLLLSSSSESLSALKFCLDPDEREELEDKVLEWVGLTVCDFKSEIAFSGIDNAKLSKQPEHL